MVGAFGLELLVRDTCTSKFWFSSFRLFGLGHTQKIPHFGFSDKKEQQTQEDYSKLFGLHVPRHERGLLSAQLVNFRGSLFLAVLLLITRLSFLHF